MEKWCCRLAKQNWNKCKTGRKHVASGVLNPAESGTKYTHTLRSLGTKRQDFGHSFECQDNGREHAQQEAKLTVQKLK